MSPQGRWGRPANAQSDPGPCIATSGRDADSRIVTQSRGISTTYGKSAQICPHRMGATGRTAPKSNSEWRRRTRTDGRSAAGWDNCSMRQDWGACFGSGHHRAGMRQVSEARAFARVGPLSPSSRRECSFANPASSCCHGKRNASEKPTSRPAGRSRSDRTEARFLHDEDGSDAGQRRSARAALAGLEPVEVHAVHAGAQRDLLLRHAERAARRPEHPAQPFEVRLLPGQDGPPAAPSAQAPA